MRPQYIFAWLARRLVGSSARRLVGSSARRLVGSSAGWQKSA